eukprot:ctg_1265.g455
MAARRLIPSGVEAKADGDMSEAQFVPEETTRGDADAWVGGRQRRRRCRGAGHNSRSRPGNEDFQGRRWTSHLGYDRVMAAAFTGCGVWGRLSVSGRRASLPPWASDGSGFTSASTLRVLALPSTATTDNVAADPVFPSSCPAQRSRRRRSPTARLCSVGMLAHSEETGPAQRDSKSPPGALPGAFYGERRVHHREHPGGGARGHSAACRSAAAERAAAALTGDACQDLPRALRACALGAFSAAHLRAHARPKAVGSASVALTAGADRRKESVVRTASHTRGTEADRRGRAASAYSAGPNTRAHRPHHRRRARQDAASRMDGNQAGAQCALGHTASSAALGTGSGGGRAHPAC